LEWTLLAREAHETHVRAKQEKALGSLLDSLSQELRQPLGRIARARRCSARATRLVPPGAMPPARSWMTLTVCPA